MKAILIKSLPCTNTLPARFKVSIHGQKTFTIPCDSFDFNHSSADCLALQAAKFALEKWGMIFFSNYNFSIGQLPNNDFCVTFSLKGDK